jgi:hypothetical protein
LFVAGLLAGIGVAYMRQSGAWLRDKVANWGNFGPSRRGFFSDGPTPVYRVPRAKSAGQSDTIPF